MIRLDKYIKQVRGISYSPSDISEVPLEDYLPILKANNIQENTLDTSNLIYIHKSKIKNEQLIRKGDLLLAASSGSKDIVGKNVFFEEDFNGSFGAFCKVVRSLGNIYPKFLSAFFKTPNYKRHIRNLIQGANINNLRSEDIDSLKIPEFTHQDQIIIATILSKAETLVKQRKESITLLDEFLKSKFLEMFYSNPETDKWEEVLFSKLRANDKGAMRTGPFGSSLLHSEFTETGDVKVLGIDNVVKNSFDWKRSRCITNEKFKELKRYQVFPGDVLISIMATTGRTAVVPENIPTSINSKHLAAITLNRALANPYFIAFAFHSHPIILRQLKSNVKGAIMEGLNLTIIKKIKFRLPPIELQNTFAKIVEKVEALKTQQQQSLQELENLYGSLSQSAFKGELDISNISLSPFEVDGKPWPEPGGKGYGDPFEGIEGLPDDGRMFGAEEFKKLTDTGRWEDVTNTNLDEIETSSAHQPVARRKVASELERNIGIDIQSEELARFIQNKFYSAHFNSEMLLEMLETHGRAVHYFTSEELKFENKTEGRLDLKKFIFDCLRGANPHLRLEQFFHNAFERRTELVIVNQFSQKYAEMDSAEKTGIYFKILS